MQLAIQLTAIGILVISIILIFVHHFLTHDGKFFDVEDFEKAITGIFSSHEGIIILLSFFIVGAILIG